MRKTAVVTAVVLGFASVCASTARAQQEMVSPMSCDIADCFPDQAAPPDPGVPIHPQTSSAPGPYVIFPPGFNYGGGLKLGGIYDREGPAAIVFDKKLYVAWTASNDPYGDPASDQYIHILHEDGAGGGKDVAYPRVNTRTGTTISDATPALVGFNGRLFLAMNSQNRGAGGFASIFSSQGVTDGDAFYSDTFFTGAPYVDSSPSLATDGTYLYLGLRNWADHTITICRIDGTRQGKCFNHPGTNQINFNPALACRDGVLYIASEDYDNSHQLRLYRSDDQGQSFYELTQLQQDGDRTSTVPSLAVHNHYLYLGFRTNDNDHKFLYRYSIDGANFVSRIDMHYTMGSAPALVSGTELEFNHTYLYNLYGSDPDKFLYESEGSPQ